MLYQHLSPGPCLPIWTPSRTSSHSIIALHPVATELLQMGPCSLYLQPSHTWPPPNCPLSSVCVHSPSLQGSQAQWLLSVLKIRLVFTSLSVSTPVTCFRRPPSPAAGPPNRALSSSSPSSLSSPPSKQKELFTAMGVAILLGKEPDPIPGPGMAAWSDPPPPITHIWPPLCLPPHPPR